MDEVMNISEDEFKIIRYATVHTDGLNDRTLTKQLHGSGNYVAHMKYLWYFAVFLGREPQANTKTELNNSIINARNQAKEKLRNTSSWSDDSLQELMANSGALIKHEKFSGGTIPSPRKMKLTVWGFSMHLLGDTFAHQVVIPPKTPIGNVAQNSSNPQFSKYHFTSFSTNVYGSGTFRIRKLVDKDTNGRYIYVENNKDARDLVNKTYIDNPKFYSSRYKRANLGTHNFFKDSNQATFNYNLYFMAEPLPNVKLFNLQKHAKAAGCNTSKFEWEKFTANE